jgi:hypothetical protein
MPRNDKELDEIPSGKIKMGKSFFANMRNRVETIRPVAGDYIKVEEEKGYGLKISGNFDVVTLNVCSNGVPATLVVFAGKPATST